MDAVADGFSPSESDLRGSAPRAAVRAAAKADTSAAADHEDLSSAIAEVLTALGADGALAVLYGRGTQPEVLLAIGDHLGTTVDRRNDDAAGGRAESLAATAAPRWAALEGSPRGAQLIMRLPLNNGSIAVSAAFRRIDAERREQVLQTMLTMLPVLRAACRLWEQAQAMLVRISALTSAVDRSGVSIFLADHLGQLRFANAAGAALLATDDGLHCKNMRLTGNRLSDTLSLQAAIEHGASMANGDKGGRAWVIMLSRMTGRPLIAVVAANADCDDCTVVLHVFDPDQDLQSCIAPACRCYGLSPVETKLAALLAQGLSLTEASERMRVREQTARSYLKQIFLKTDTNRQAGLVSLMLRSAVCVGPDCALTFN